MIFHTFHKTKYDDGTLEPTPENVVYLGTYISKHPNPRREIDAKISKCVFFCKQTEHFWNTPNCLDKIQNSSLRCSNKVKTSAQSGRY